MLYVCFRHANVFHFYYVIIIIYILLSVECCIIWSKMLYEGFYQSMWLAINMLPIISPDAEVMNNSL